MIYLAVTFALALVCAAGTWMAYRLFLRLVNIFDRRALARWNAEEEERAAESVPAADDADEWPEIILLGDDEEIDHRLTETKRKRLE